jgi:hypothetical protein
VGTFILGSTICEHTTEEFILGARIKLFSYTRINDLEVIDEDLNILDFRYTSEPYDSGYMYYIDIYDVFDYIAIYVYKKDFGTELHGFKSKSNTAHYFCVTEDDSIDLIEAVNWENERIPIPYYKKSIDGKWFYSAELEDLPIGRYSITVDNVFSETFFVGR